MTQTEPQPSTGAAIPLHPADILMNLIVALLAPMFLGAAAGDIGFARQAAIETVNAYRIRNNADLLAVAQIIGFGLGALGSLSLSMLDEISLAMTLRLRGNAVALNRSAEQNRRALRDPAGDAPAPHWSEAQAEPDPRPADVPDVAAHAPHVPLLSEAAERQLAEEAKARLCDADRPACRASVPPRAQAQAQVQAVPAATTTMDKRYEEMRAIAMVKEAGDLHVSFPGLPPVERKAASMRITALSSTAHELLTGQCLPQGAAGQAIPAPPGRI
jgi:hypothetical protein